MNSKSIQNEFQVNPVEDGYKRLFALQWTKHAFSYLLLPDFVYSGAAVLVDAGVIEPNAGSRRIVYQKVPGHHSF